MFGFTAAAAAKAKRQKQEDYARGFAEGKTMELRKAIQRLQPFAANNPDLQRQIDQLEHSIAELRPVVARCGQSPLYVRLAELIRKAFIM